MLFTGLSGAGKSTLANGLAAMLRERGGRRVMLLDGDVVRRRLSGELGLRPGFQVAGSPRAPAGYDYGAKLRIAPAGL